MKCAEFFKSILIMKTCASASPAAVALELARAKALLADRAGADGTGALPIQRPYTWDADLALDIGTVTTLVMDLRARELHVTKGSPAAHGFETERFSK